jgi:GAF domain-containing protein
MLLPRLTGERVAADLDWFFRRDGSTFPVSYVSAPLDMPEGRGAVVAFTDIEDRLRAEQELRGRSESLAADQAAQRRVAGLVARGLPPAEVFEAVAREVGVLLGVDATHIGRYEGDATATLVATWSRTADQLPIGMRAPTDGENVCSLVLRTGRPARVDSYDDAAGPIAEMLKGLGMRASVGAPIVVDGRLWGAAIASSKQEGPLPADVEARIAVFTELVATAISNTEARAETRTLAEEQAALRRVATLVAREPSPAEIFGTVAEEVAQLLRTEGVALLRFELDGDATLVAQSDTPWEPIPLGTRFLLDGENVVTAVHRTGDAARLDDWSDATGSVAATAHTLGLRSSVATPVVVGGRLWGTLVSVTRQVDPLAANTESRIGEFTELVATAISNAEARGELSRLADEQSALRRVATLVAEGVPSRTLFDAVTAEVGSLLQVNMAGMIRYVTDDSVAAVATWAAAGGHPEVPGVWSLDGDRLASTILKTGSPAREDDWAGVSGPIAAFVREQLGIRSSVGSPIVVEGRVWGALFVHSTASQPLPGDTESRLSNFTELVATAIAGAQSRTDVRHLADEQAALRRVATLVAREPPPDEVFAAVAEELGQLLGLEDTRMIRYEDDGTASVVATWGRLATEFPVGTRIALDGVSAGALVHRTREPVRLDDFADAPGTFAATLRRVGVRSAVGAPVVVDGRLWGAMIAASLRPDPIPADTEARMCEFTELVATAISNLNAHSELAASRARIVAAGVEERRQVVRDLHDGAQQRLVHAVVTLKLARRALEEHADDAPALVSEAIDQAEQATAELRELAHGILPAVLSRGGLRAGVEALALRMPVPTHIDVTVGRVPATVEATAYFVVAEALTNIAKHARARQATVKARVEDGTLDVTVGDDGVGGARPDGSGLVGLADRLAALDGELRVKSPVGGGTVVAAAIPLADPVR